jgi:hypothetical protein
VVRLDGHESVVIAEAKLRDYLLSDTHPVGRFKAAFLRALGFSSENWAELDSAIRAQVVPLDVAPGKPSPHGTKYETDGILRGPNDRAARVVVVWIVYPGDSRRHLLTLYPGEAT